MAFRAFSFRALYQLGFSILIIVALVAQFVYGATLVRGGASAYLYYVGLFVSYFTILSNIFVALVLCAEARASIQGKELSPEFERLRGAAVFCIFTTGIIYSLFLKGPGGQGMIQDAVPWINNVFHYIMPTVMTLDWILFPTKKPVHWHSILYWIALTALYLIYAEALGFFTKAYPYFFVDPSKLHGYEGVFRASLGFIPFFVVFGFVIVLMNRLRLRFR